MIRAVLACLCLLAALPAARADSRSVSHSLWVISGQTIMLRYTLPTGLGRLLVKPGWPPPTATTVAHYVLSHMSVQAAGEACPAIDQGYDLGLVDPLFVGANRYGFEIMFRCAKPTDLILRNEAMFDKSPGHIDFAQVQVNGGALIPRLFTSRQQQLRLRDDAAPQASGPGSYLHIGFVHICSSFDRICFVFGLLLVARRRNELGYLLAGLSLGYAAAATVAAGGLIAARPDAAEAWMGFMVIFAAALLVARETRRPRRTAAALAAGLLLLAAAAALSRNFAAALLLFGAAIFAASFLQMSLRVPALPMLWLVPTAIFGFLDGFVLPADLATLQLSTLLPPADVFAFNAGAVLAEVLLMAVLLAAVILARRKNLTVPGPLMKDLSAAALAGLGTFWLLVRLNA